MDKIFSEADLDGMDAAALCRLAVEEKGGVNVRLANGALIVVTAFSTGRDTHTRPDGTPMSEAALGELEAFIQRARSRQPGDPLFT